MDLIRSDGQGGTERERILAGELYDRGPKGPGPQSTVFLLRAQSETMYLAEVVEEPDRGAFHDLLHQDEPLLAPEVGVR